MLKNGWICVWRKMQEWEWWSGNSNILKVFLHIIMNANTQDKVWRGQLIKRGQLVTSLNSLALGCYLHREAVRKALKHLLESNDITIEGTHRYSIITVCNYALYQDKSEDTDTPKDTPKDTNVTNNNKQVTSNNEQNNNYTHTAREQKIFLKFLGIVNDFTEADRLTSEFQTHNANKTDEWWEKGLWENHISGFVENDRNFKKEKSCGKKEKAKPRYTYQEFCEAITNKQNPRKQSDFEHIQDSEGKHWWVLKE